MQDLFRKMKHDIDKEAFVSCINTVTSIIFFFFKQIHFLFVFLDVQLEKVVGSAPLMTIIQSTSLYEMLLT